MSFFYHTHNSFGIALKNKARWFR